MRPHRHNVNPGSNRRFQRFFLNGDLRTVGHTDGQTDPLLEMRGRILKGVTGKA